MTTKVTLRQKSITKGRKSLYLDFYPPIDHPETGQPTRREFLKLYIIDKVNHPLDKQHNEEIFNLAEQIRQKRQNRVNKPEVYSDFEKEVLRIKELGQRDFIQYFKDLVKKRKSSNHHNWLSALYYLETFTAGNLKFADLNEKLFEDFKEFLLATKSKRSDKTTLSINSAASYFNKVKAALKQAYKDGILQTDLNAKIESITEEETHREFLTLEELNQLVKTPCNYDMLKRAALFSALTGLRFSDIQKLIWDEIEYVKDQGYKIKYRQKKTKGAETLPISEQAYSILGEQGEPKGKVFKGLKYSAYNNIKLDSWVKAAGIKKKIRFHSFRHTFATLQLSNETKPTTIQKMLGHKNLKTTMIYAKVVDLAKREAADKIKLDL